MMKRLLAIAAALLLPVAGAAAAPQVKTPDCSALALWGSSFNPTDKVTIAPRIQLPKPLGDDALVPLFGVPLLSWTPEDVQATDQAFRKCGAAAQQAHDQQSFQALVNGDRALGLINQVNGTVQHARADAAATQKQIDALPDSPELARGLDAVVKGNPAQPDLNQFRPLPPPVGGPTFHLAQIVTNLPDADRDTLNKALAARRDAIQSKMAGSAEQSIGAASQDAAGIIALMQAKQGAAGLADADARGRISKEADDKANQIRAALKQAKPAVFVPPDCLDFYRWAAMPNPNAGVGLGGTVIFAAFTDERVVPVFGVSVADWTNDDLARFKTVRDICRAASQPQGAPPEAQELVQLGNRARWIDNADQPLVNAHNALVTYQKAKEELSATLAKAQALPDVANSLLPLAQAAGDPAQGQVTQEDRVAYQNAINAKRQSIGVHSTDAAVKGLNDIKVASLSDMPKLVGYVGQTVPTIPDPVGRQNFLQAVNKTVNDTATRLLPEFQTQLAALPPTLDGAKQANTALAKATGIADVARIPAFKPFIDAQDSRQKAIMQAVHDQACKDYLSSAGVGSDGAKQMWDGQDNPTLGDYLCSIVTRGAQVNSYSGSGMFSSGITIKITPLYQALLTVSMHPAPVQNNQTMLVGYKIVDADGKPGSQFGTQEGGDGSINVEQWELFAHMTMGITGREEEACRKLNLSDVDKLSPGDKLFYLYCVDLPSQPLTHKPSAD